MCKIRKVRLQLHNSFFCCSDDSDDSDGALGPGLSLDLSAQHAALTVKSEPCEPGDGLPDGKPLNGVLLQGKGTADIGNAFFKFYLCYSHVLGHAQLKLFIKRSHPLFKFNRPKGRQNKPLQFFQAEEEQEVAQGIYNDQFSAASRV